MSGIIIGGRSSRVFVASDSRMGHSGDNIEVLGLSEELLEVSILVPRGTSIRTRGLVGDAEIAGTEASLRLAVDAADVQLGRIRDAVLDVTGSGNIEVAAVEGNLDVRCPGSGSVQVQGGDINVLNVVLDGACDIWVGARALHANLRLEGAGDIYIKEVVTRPEIHEDGAGSIRVGNWVVGK